MATKSLNRVLRCSNPRHKSCSPCTQYRSFTTSPTHQKRGAVPKFDLPESSPPELSTLLSNIRSKIFLPAYITPSQRAIIHSTKSRRMLEEDPISVTLGPETFTLAYINRTTDVPSPRKSVLEAIDLFKTKGEWDNLPALLEGMKHAGVEITWQRIVRAAGEAGRCDVLLECLRRSAETGFVLRVRGLCDEFMYWILREAADSDWDGKKVRKALNMAEEVMRLCENKELWGEYDPRRLPQTIAVLLRLSVAKAEALTEGKDADGKIEMYARRLIDVTEGDAEVAKIMEVEGEMTRPQRRHWLRAAIPILSAWETTAKRLFPGKVYQQRASVLRKKVDEIYAVEERDGFGRDGNFVAQHVWAHDKLLSNS